MIARAVNLACVAVMASVQVASAGGARLIIELPLADLRECMETAEALGALLGAGHAEEIRMICNSVTELSSDEEIPPPPPADPVPGYSAEDPSPVLPYDDGREVRAL